MIARSLQAKVLVFAVFFIGIATGVLIADFYEARVTGSRPEPAPSPDALGPSNPSLDVLPYALRPTPLFIPC